MASKVNISILPCLDEDISTCFQVMSKSFGHDAPFVDIYFPDHDTPHGQELGARRLLAWKRDEPESTFLKAVVQDGPGDQGQIIGLAVWTHMKEPPPADLEKLEDVKEVWPDEEDREYMKALWRDYVVPRGQVVREANGAGIYVLELLAVHPDWQRHGAGTALVMWGINKAENQGLEAIVESAPAGRRCYEKCGLRAEIDEMRFDVGERFNKRKKPVLSFHRKRAQN